MPQPGMMWRHVIINTRNTWLPGDPRGFRNRDHRIHSSGDYKSLPPEDEHRKLHAWMNRRSSATIVLAKELRQLIEQTLVDHMNSKGYTSLVVAVGAIHTHALVELPNDIRLIRRIIGDAKKKASRAVRSKLPGRIWADGGAFKLVESRAHHRKVSAYILTHEREGAWVWSFRDRKHGRDC